MGTSAEVKIKSKTSYYYLTEKTKFMVKDLEYSMIDILIKQNNSNIFDVEFDSPIIWKDHDYTSSRIFNNFDYIRLLNIPETEHFFGEIVKSNFSY